MTASNPACRDAGHRADGGFMLVEMLVAMGIGALLLVALASVTSFVLRSHDRILRQAQMGEDMGRSLAALAREIKQADHLKWAGQTGGLVFAGSADRLLFAREAAGADGSDEAEATLFQIQSSDGRTSLLRSEARLPPSAASPADLTWSPPTVVYVGEARAAFAYFMALDGGGEALLDGWPAGDEMPIAVRVSLVGNGPESRTMSLRVPLFIDADPSCALPGSSACGAPREGTEPQETDDGPNEPVDADDPQGWGRYVR